MLLTNDDTLTLDDAASAYKSMVVIEQCFRSLKRTQIHLGPMFHRLSERIEAHVKICVLALLIQRVAERATQQSWARLQDLLHRVQATGFRTPSHQFFQRNTLGPEVREVLRMLEISISKRLLAIQPRSPTL